MAASGSTAAAAAAAAVDTSAQRYLVNPELYSLLDLWPTGDLTEKTLPELRALQGPRAPSNGVVVTVRSDRAR